METSATWPHVVEKDTFKKIKGETEMKRNTWLVIAIVVALSTLACSLTGGGIEMGEEVAVTQPPVESGDEQPISPSEPGDEQPTSPSEPDDVDIEITGQIPEGYPENEIPIYEPASSAILGGSKLENGDTLFYNLVIGSNDDVQTVTQNIRNKLENESTEFEDMGSMLMGVKGEWEYIITINSGEADGYGTLVTYTLTKRQ